MSYKHDGKKTNDWLKWLKAHRLKLIECGVPDAALETEHHWIRFLEEDGCDYISGWFPSMLSPSQAQALHSFIRENYGAMQYRSFLRDLEDVSSGKHTT
ncbi:MAG: hypothetical protein FWC42_03135 [Proteobacteria bacterium]|nr:hypothetical protein [Pseudomonadota bacterium]